MFGSQYREQAQSLQHQVSQLQRELDNATAKQQEMQQQLSELRQQLQHSHEEQHRSRQLITQMQQMGASMTDAQSSMGQLAQTMRGEKTARLRCVKCRPVAPTKY